MRSVHDLQPRNPNAWRWWGAALGLGTGLFDAKLMELLGVQFALNGRDVMLWVGAYFGVSFAMLGYLLGVVAASRRRDRQTAEVIQRQMLDLQQARVRLAHSEKLATLGQLAAAIAHEVRTPLAVMRSASQNLAESVGDTNPDAGKSCSFVIAEIDRLTNVVSSLLAFARPVSLRRQPAQIAAVIRRTLLLAEADLGTQRVRLRQQAAADLPVLAVDADLVCQALLGLLANAVQAAGPGGDVEIRASACDDSIEVAVEDSGPGVPPGLRERIFEPFFTTRPQGTGLGLAVVRQIVEAHGGVLQVGERVGGGARFAMRFPVEVGA